MELFERDSTKVRIWIALKKTLPALRTQRKEKFGFDALICLTKEHTRCNPGTFCPSFFIDFVDPVNCGLVSCNQLAVAVLSLLVPTASGFWTGSSWITPGGFDSSQGSHLSRSVMARLKFLIHESQLLSWSDVGMCQNNGTSSRSVQSSDPETAGWAMLHLRRFEDN